MISYLKGKILHKNGQQITLAGENIGYEVNVTSRLAETLETNQIMELYIHTKVREDNISLYGFQTSEELNLFKNLISISGVGPKSALEILSGHPDQIKSAIVQKNIAYLSKIPGIGKKTAERICIDLQNKITALTPDEFTSIDENSFDEVITALLGLGYQKYEIKRFLSKLPENKTSSEEIITHFLQTRI